MNKKLSPLEALKELKKQMGNIRLCRFDLEGGTPQITTQLVRDSGLFEIIETALERLNELEDIFSEIESGEAVVVSAEKNIALEIIKEKSIDVHSFMLGININTYEDFIQKGRKYGWFRDEPTEQEYELLNEVLNDSGIVKTEAR